MTATTNNTRRAGFTLIELLVTIGVIAVIIGVLIPTIAGIWSKSRDFVDVSNMRSTHVDFVSWSADRGGAIANAGSPFESTVASRGYYGMFHNDERGWSLYTLQNELWPNLLRQDFGGQVQPHWHSSYAEFTEEDLQAIPSTLTVPGETSNPHNPGISSPNSPEPGPGVIEDMTMDDFFGDAIDYRNGSIAHLQTEYRLGLTLLTDARVWSNPGAVRSTRWVRNSARRVDFNEVTNPARKGLLYHNEWPRADEGFHHVAFVDGHVELKNWADAMPTAVSPFDTTGVPGEPVNATFNGYRGIDF